MRNVVTGLGVLFLVFFSCSVSAQQTYVVKPGDTLYEISLTHGISWKELAELNEISDPRKMQVGTVLRLPAHTPDVIYLHDGSVCRVSEEEMELLAKLVYSEARGESLEGKIAVAAVVINRVRSEAFPDTVWDVIYEPRQFTPVEQNILPNHVDEVSMRAARLALQGEDPTDGALFFYNPRKTKNSDFWKTRTVIKRIGNHNFAL